MHIKKALTAFRTQKSNAAKRGIGFNLTFKQWCEFWGGDIDRRGNRHDQLQMQRLADTGPYEIGNIRKGYPKQNSATYQKMRSKRETEAASKDLQANLDAAMFAESLPEYDSDDIDPTLHALQMKSSYSLRYNY